MVQVNGVETDGMTQRSAGGQFARPALDPSETPGRRLTGELVEFRSAAIRNTAKRVDLKSYQVRVHRAKHITRRLG